MILLAELLLGDSHPVHRPPDIPDVGDHERDEQRDDAHHIEREPARGAVVDRQGALRIGQRGVVGRIVVPGCQQQTEHGQHRARAGEPDTPAAPAEQPLGDAPQHGEDTCDQQHENDRHRKQVVQILVRLLADPAACRIDRPAPGEQQRDQKGHERRDECRRVPAQVTPRPVENAPLVDVVHEVEQAEYARKEQNGQSQQNVARVGQRVESVPWSSPLRDGVESVRAREVGPVDRELRAEEQRAYGRSEQESPRYAVDDQKGVERLFAQKVRRLASVLVRDGLNDEYEQDQHPDVEGPAEARAVKERERREEGSAERDERREREFPFPSQRVDDQVAFRFGASDRVEHRLSALYEQQEDQQRPEQRDDEPPVVLQENMYRIHSSFRYWLSIEVRSCAACASGGSGPMRICRVMIISSAISSVVNSTTNRKKAVISEPVLILETEATVGSRS